MIAPIPTSGAIAWLCLIAATAVMAAGGGGYLWGRADGRAIEQSAFAEQIRKSNEEAGDAAETWRADFRRCNDAGGLFNFETGACDR